MALLKIPPQAITTAREVLALFLGEEHANGSISQVEHSPTRKYPTEIVITCSCCGGQWKITPETCKRFDTTWTKVQHAVRNVPGPAS